MEEALECLKSWHDSEAARATLSLLQVYFKNIIREPQNPKFRKIRINNPKFNSVIWKLEPGRTLLFLAGFEQEEEFLVLPPNVSVSAIQLLIEEALGIHPPQATSGEALGIGKNLPQQDQKESQTSTSGTPVQQTTLKLHSQSQAGTVLRPDVKADLTLLSYMKEMGYDVKVAEKALIATSNKGVQPAMDWITQNPSVFTEVELAACSPEAIAEKTPSSSMASANAAARLGLTSSGPAPVSRYQKTIDERHKFQEKLRLEAIEAARLDKQEKKIHKRYLLKDMEDEKQEKKEKAEQAKLVKTAGQTSEEQEITEEASEPASLASASQAELRIRMPDGQVSVITLPKDEKIYSLYQHVCRSSSMKTDDFVIITTYPHAVLENMEASLESSGLVPRAALVVQRKDQQGHVAQGEGKVCVVKEMQSMDEWQSMETDVKDKLVVVEFYVPWCSKCRSISDAFESLNAKYAMDNRASFLRVNMDEFRALKYQHQVTSFPTFNLIWNGKIVTTIQGPDMEKLEEFITTNLSGPPVGLNDEDEESIGEPVDEDFVDPR